jgi:hypothetical protein
MEKTTIKGFVVVMFTRGEIRRARHQHVGSRGRDRNADVHPAREVDLRSYSTDFGVHESERPYQKVVSSGRFNSPANLGTSEVCAARADGHAVGAF